MAVLAVVAAAVTTEAVGSFALDWSPQRHGTEQHVYR